MKNMSLIQRLRCDNCKKIADTANHYEAGWIELNGTLSVGTGQYDEKKSQWKLALYIDGGQYHFCSWNCLKNFKQSLP